MNRERGFTLVELMITLVIAAIVLTLAVPGFRDLIQNNRITTQANELVSALNLARMEAIRQGTPVSVCASADQASCSGANNWATGWIVFTDPDGDGNITGGETLLRAWGALAGNPTLSENGGASRVQYQNNGTTGAPFNFTHTIPGCTGNQQRTIGVSAAGRVGVTTGACP